jgi:hypothetical protein
LWFNPGLARLFITSTLLHLREDINILVVLINFVIILYYLFASLYRCRVEVIISYNFGSSRQVPVESSCKSFKYDFNVSWEVSALVGIIACAIIRLYLFNIKFMSFLDFFFFLVLARVLFLTKKIFYYFKVFFKPCIKKSSHLVS